VPCRIPCLAFQIGLSEKLDFARVQALSDQPFGQFIIAWLSGEGEARGAGLQKREDGGPDLYGNEGRGPGFLGSEAQGVVSSERAGPFRGRQGSRGLVVENPVVLRANDEEVPAGRTLKGTAIKVKEL
tara:strand:- start:464 stop:847 length:384 start_codon:yes stop_codon:yes gene_type:complete